VVVELRALKLKRKIAEELHRRFGDGELQSSPDVEKLSKFFVFIGHADRILVN
jgi:hypothetical protein